MPAMRYPEPGLSRACRLFLFMPLLPVVFVALLVALFVIITTMLIIVFVFVSFLFFFFLLLDHDLVTRDAAVPPEPVPGLLV